ncbi:uncharacterized protein LOC124143149 [Haliotis rufescens]|uniref:uncharacterized protein LOC124143149 n=1 Tax=Haliotis rufescens TaxID=6454 RepID=UPI00201EC481|nr:uncharacterized protein LOC124143149 [Haliotis rufescens]
MGCRQTKVKPMKQTSPEEALAGKINCPHELYYAKWQVAPPTPRLTGDEILQQLRDDGLVPVHQTRGGVAFSVPATECGVARGKPPRRLEQIPVRCFYTAERRRQKADEFRFDRLVEQVQRKQLDREIKHKAVKDEKKRRVPERNAGGASAPDEGRKTKETGRRKGGEAEEPLQAIDVQAGGWV